MLAIVGLALSLLVASPASVNARETPTRSPSPTAVTATTGEGRTGAGTAGLTGFVLIGGWLVLGALLFRQGRRRLRGSAADGATEDDA